uniref:Peptidase M13 C-terminal domain-containing protein n=1 Tax=Glossina palpalis gambiensis TaxID=67801 RepID=A0A1B0C1Y8_9MUSC
MKTKYIYHKSGHVNYRYDAIVRKLLVNHDSLLNGKSFAVATSSIADFLQGFMLRSVETMYLKTNVETFKVSITVLLLFVLVRKDNGCWAQTSIADVVILNDLLNWEHINRTCLARDCEEQVNLKQLQQINTYMNDEADPCEDFHKYACEHWKKQHPNEMTMAAVAYKQITKKLLEIFEDNKSEFKAELQNNAIYRKLNDYYKFLSHLEADKLNFLDNVHSPYKCVHHMRKIFDLPMNYLYEKVFYSKIRTESDQLIKNVFEELKQTFAEIVEENQLKFADRNKKYLMSKLNGVSLNIGNLPANVSDDFYQNYLQDYQVTNNFYLNHLLALKHYYTQQLSLASSLKDSTPWISFQNYDPFVLDSATSTAGYSYVTAAITLPFSYLQVPFYTPQFWPPLLYGDLATTLGHELIHAFDPTFLSFDSDGKLANLDFELISKNWHYKNAINCLLRIPTQFLEERVADVSGSRLALLTFKPFNEEDTSHDMDSVRLNYTMSNLLEFAETFGCRSDASMNPRTKCQLWILFRIRPAVTALIMFYKTFLNDSKFHILDLSPIRGRRKIYGNIKLLPLHIVTRSVTNDKHKIIMFLLPNIPPIKWKDDNKAYHLLKSEVTFIKMYLKTNFKTLKISITVLLLCALIRKPTDSWAQANIADVVIFNDLLNWEHVNRTCLARDCDEHFLSHLESDKLNFLDNVHSPYKCVHHMRKIFDLPMNYLYEKVFYSKIRTESDQLIKNVFEELKQTFAEIVEENQLKFADRNKKYLMSKLNGVSLNIGNLPANVSDDFYQNYLQDYQVTNNFYLNHLLALKHYYTQQLSLGSSLNDNAPWFSFESLDPFVLDSISTATYFSVTNMITLPFTYLQVPFYSPQFWPPLLYGDLATTMGHELIHAFDPGSLVYDSGGKLAEMEFKLISKNWHYKNAIKCLNHKPTEFLDERVADVSGSRLALLTFKRKYFFSPSNAKLFFLQYAQFFCGSADNFGEFHAQDSTHDIDGVRLNYTLSHSSEFAEIFGCPTDSPMNPRTKCQLW